MTQKKFLDSAYDLQTADDTRAFYSSWAESYDEEISQNGYASPMRTAQALKLSGANLNAPLLDIGCGTGVSGLFLNEAGFANLDGSDFSKEMLGKAKDKNIYKNLYLADLNRPFDFIERTYQNFTAIGVFSPAHAGPEVLFSIFEMVPMGGYFAFSLNDHALEDTNYLDNVETLVKSHNARMRWMDYGDHLPKIDLNSVIVVLEKK